MKTLLRISFIVTIAITINACGSKTPSQTTNHRPEQVIEKPSQSEAEKPNDTEKVTISEDSIRKEMEREQERRREGYAKELERFETVLNEASDKELLIVLKYAIIHHYVPTYDVDPYFNVFAGVGSWHRTKMIYDKLSRRPDLLRKIYPNLGILRDYVNRNEFVQPFTDTVASQTILRNAQKDGKYFVDSLMGVRSDTSSLAYKYFGTPLMRYK